MRIFDEVTKKSLNNITILFEKDEISQLIGYLEDLLSTQNQNEHFHLNNEDYSKEITLALYDLNQSLDSFSDRYRDLILFDE